MKDTPCLLLIASSKPERTPAFERAVAMARGSGARLRIVALDHVKLLEIMGLFNPEALTNLRDSHLQPLRRWLESQVQKERDKGLDVDLRVLWTGHVFEEIQHCIKNVRPSMLIKDVHHEPSLQRLFSTPLDWELLRHCACPVQLVTRSTHPLPVKMLAAVNLYRSRDADLRLNDQILKVATQLAAQCGAVLHVVYVYDRAAIYASGTTIMGAMPVEPGFQEALSDAHEESFSLLCAQHGIAQRRRHFMTGAPQPTIEAFARLNDFDLLVMGTMPRPGLERVMGDTAEVMLTHAPCSVLVVKADSL
ncbi:universal stress protein [Pseudomonas sp. KU26590]|uniref:universal stress protein n=1 Tax=Pseudomonas sp. KU26590 TaxID=2991051 RepID=UPI00223DFA69|nr:universal stress protein [Pseudomonas sp. KU26590]UZJ59461.1 universal stress protein [Pseudomonas sp. KU26590]